MAEAERRRRRIRAERHSSSSCRVSPQDLADRPTTFALTTSVHDVEADPLPNDGTRCVSIDNVATHVDKSDESAHSRDDLSTERGLRGLIGGSSSQVSVTTALRARDIARPTEADIASAETSLVIVRRGWVPREDLAPPTRPR